MILKKWKKDSTYYIMKVNFKTHLAYTDIIQITLKEPWFFPKYEDNFAGIPGLRLYGWLFFYFGRYYAGIVYPAFDNEKTNLQDKAGKYYHIVFKDKIKNFKKYKNLLKLKNVNVLFEKINEKDDGSYDLSCFVYK